MAGKGRLMLLRRSLQAPCALVLRHMRALFGVTRWVQRGFVLSSDALRASRTTHACLAPKCLFWAPQPPRPNPSTARVGFPRDDRCRECGWWSRLWLGCGQYCVPCTTDLEHFLYYRHLSIQTSYLVQKFIFPLVNILHPTRQSTWGII